MEYIFFDFDGTLVDTQEGVINCLLIAMEHMNFTPAPDADLTEFLGPPIKPKFAEYCNFTDEEAGQAVAKFREHYNAKGLYESSPYAGIEETLKRLHSAGKKLFVATSKPERSAKILADKFGLTQYFTEITGSTFDGTRTTKSQVIAELISRIGDVDTAKVLMVGDRLHDVHGAAEFGIATLGVTYGYGDRAELEEAGAKYIVDTTSEIADLILANNCTKI